MLVFVAPSWSQTFAISQDQQAVDAVRQSVNVLWPIFDLSGSGTIDRAEFIAQDGLGDAIVASM
jgi:hypothetical protein